MMSAGIPQSMLVIGKPATVADAKPGYMNTTYLGQCVNEAKQKGWNAGVMTWEVRTPFLFVTILLICATTLVSACRHDLDKAGNRLNS